MMHIAIAGVLENWAFMGVCCLSALMPFDGEKDSDWLHAQDTSTPSDGTLFLFF